MLGKLRIMSGILALVIFAAACGGGGEKETSKEQAPSGGAATQGAAATAGAGATQQAAKVRRGGTLVVTLAANPQRFDPMVYTDVYSGEVVDNVIDTLVKIDDRLAPQPYLAEKIDTPDDKTYVFHLRKGVKFHDGTEVDAEAVKFSVDRIRAYKPGPDYAEANKMLETTVVDQYTFRVVLDEPYAPYLVLMSGRPGRVVSPKAVKEMGDEKFSLNPVGSGPFRFVEWKNDNYIKIEKFKDYWRQGADGQPLPYLDGVEWRIITEPTTRLSALQAGDVHIAGVRDQDLPVVKNDKNLQWKQQIGANWSGMVLTITKPPFDNKALRQAVSYAINQEEIVKAIYEGNAEPASGPIPPPHAWARDPNFKPYPNDLAKAKEKLAEGGKPAGFEFTAYYTAGSSQTQQLAELIQAQLAKVGIKMNVEYADFNGVVVPKARNGESNAYSIGFNCGYGDPDGCISRRFLAGSGFNYMNYDNPKANELILEARRISDREKRAQLYKEAVKVVMDDNPFIFTHYGVDRFTGSKAVQGWYVGVKYTAGYSEYWLSQ